MCIEPVGWLSRRTARRHHPDRKEAEHGVLCGPHVSHVAYSTAVVRNAGTSLAPKLGQVAELYARVLEQMPWLKGRLSTEGFSRAVAESVAKRFRGSTPDARGVATYVESLHIEDLALAVACAAGDEAAWDHFITTRRPILYRAARALTRDETGARDLADALWAELYGVGGTRKSLDAGSPRRSLLEYFHGRSKLSTWLRSVLAQRYVDHERENQRLESLEGLGPETVRDPGRRNRFSRSGAPGAQHLPDPDRVRYLATFQEVLAGVLGTLDPRDRLRLSYYYAQELTLAETGRLMGEHEATVSRKLARTRKRIRQVVEQNLKHEHHLSQAEIEQCYQYAMDDGVIELGETVSTKSSADRRPSTV